jgi:hypothetical protein
VFWQAANTHIAVLATTTIITFRSRGICKILAVAAPRVIRFER